MKIIGAGFGRTGTLSLRIALERLGFEPCYHMLEVAETPGHAEWWLEVVQGKTARWEEIFAPYAATVDVPGCLFFKELVAAYPDARVILTLRDPARWYDSMISTVYQTALMPPWMKYFPRVGPFLRLANAMIWDGFFNGRFTDRADAIQRFNEHNRTVQQTVPSDKLLVFRVEDGWEPLCGFLGAPVPDGPFPHANDRVEVKKRMRLMRTIGWGVPAVSLLLVVLLLWSLLF